MRSPYGHVGHCKVLQNTPRRKDIKFKSHNFHFESLAIIGNLSPEFLVDTSMHTHSAAIFFVYLIYQWVGAQCVLFMQFNL